MSDPSAAAAPTVSVVIAHYRGERFIDACLASVAAQTSAALEVIVVDDASGADSQAHLRRYEPTIQLLLRERNSGPADSRNAGAARARGEWLAFLDCDDLWEPTKLARQLEHLRAHPECAGCYVGMVAFFADGSETAYLDKPSPLTLADCLTGTHLLPSSLMIRREVFLAAGGYDRRFQPTEDEDLAIRLVAAGHRIEFIAAPLARLRRQNHGNLTTHWDALLRAKLALSWHHRAHFRRCFGPGALRRRVASVLRREGARAPRWAGWPLRGLAAVLTLVGAALARTSQGANP
jgi:glycosyltransferase involved in cell wall biosynthesis